MSENERLKIVLRLKMVDKLSDKLSDRLSDKNRIRYFETLDWDKYLLKLYIQGNFLNNGSN